MTISSKTQSHLTLPVIDFSIPNLKPASPEWDSVRAQVRTALEEYGCFEALFNGASVELRKALFEASEEFFDLPLETKLRTKSDKLYKGYAEKRLIQKAEVGNLETGYRKNVQSFAENLIALDVKVRKMIMESFGLEKYVEEHLNSARKHFLDGVEIKAKDGEEWIKAKPSQGSSFLVIAGASLHGVSSVSPCELPSILSVSARQGVGLLFESRCSASLKETRVLISHPSSIVGSLGLQWRAVLSLNCRFEQASQNVGLFYLYIAGLGERLRMWLSSLPVFLQLALCSEAECNKCDIGSLVASSRMAL
ncbi:hypothetical protein YC2023_012608 [Brassica napus]